MNKKAASLLVGIIIGLILLLVVTTVYYTFFQKVSVSTKGAVINSACKASLDLTAARIKGPFKTTLMEFGTQPRCEIYDVVITQKDINLVSASTGENGQDAIKRIIAEIMTEGIVVTTQDNKGNLKRRDVGGLFATVSRGQKQFFEDSAGRFCMPWATISFDKDIKEKKIEVRNFLKYLYETPMEFEKKSEEANSLTSYAGYLSNVQGGLVPTDSKDEGGNVINRQDGVISGEAGLKLLEEKSIDYFKTFNDDGSSSKFGLFYIQDVKSNWALIGTAIGIGVGVILIPFTAGLSGVAVLASTAVLIPAATGAGIAGYAIGDYVEGKGYAYAVVPIEYTDDGVKALGCDYLK